MEIRYNKKLFGEVLRFGIVGTMAVVINYAIYWLLLPFMNENPAYAIGYIISFCANYFLSARFTFKSHTTKKLQFLPPTGTPQFLHLARSPQRMGSLSDVLHRRTIQLHNSPHRFQQTLKVPCLFHHYLACSAVAHTDNVQSTLSIFPVYSNTDSSISIGTFIF